jgi:hypothetical protein
MLVVSMQGLLLNSRVSNMQAVAECGEVYEPDHAEELLLGAVCAGRSLLPKETGPPNPMPTPQPTPMPA